MQPRIRIESSAQLLKDAFACVNSNKSGLSLTYFFEYLNYPILKLFIRVTYELGIMIEKADS